MVSTPGDSANRDPELFLDISGEVCPLTFVRTKLLIATMNPGQIAEIRLAGAEPLLNVPRAVARLGHRVLSLAQEETTKGQAIHRLRIQKSPG
jgi:TusA-related sulfurtransferase